MSLTIDSICEAIQNARITCRDAPGPNDISSSDPDFEENWYRANREVGRLWCDSNPGVEAENLIYELRKAVVSQVRSHVSDPATGSYIVDDFEFILRDSMAGVDDEWIASLWSLYSRGGSPWHDH